MTGETSDRMNPIVQYSKFAPCIFGSSRGPATPPISLPGFIRNIPIPKRFQPFPGSGFPFAEIPYVACDSTHEKRALTPTRVAPFIFTLNLSKATGDKSMGNATPENAPRQNDSMRAAGGAIA